MDLRRKDPLDDFGRNEGFAVPSWNPAAKAGGYSEVNQQPKGGYRCENRLWGKSSGKVVK